MTSSVPAVSGRRRLCIAAARVTVFAGWAAMLAACNPAHYREVTSTVTPVDYRQRHPIAIKEGDRTIELFIGAKRGELTAAQRAEVMAFASAWRREATGGIIIDLPSGTRNDLAAATAVAEVRSLLSAASVPPHGVVVRPYQPTKPNRFATVKLSYPKITATAGPCGLWPDDLGPTMSRKHFENQPYWNLGCATQRNLAAMVENPADLVQPRPEIPVNTARRTTVLEKHRKGEATATVYPDATKGQISEIGR
jgi:pilus assembly protein CpaD